MLANSGRSAASILEDIDGTKFQYCLTLFLRAASEPGDRQLFEQALAGFFSGQQDAAPFRILSGQARGGA